MTRPVDDDRAGREVPGRAGARHRVGRRGEVGEVGLPQGFLSRVVGPPVGERLLGVSVQIVGNTDNQGSSAYNLMLSQERAESVRQYLIARGVDGGRLVATGHGSFYPVAPNDSEEGRAKNRRVDFKLIVP